MLAGVGLLVVLMSVVVQLCDERAKLLLSLVVLAAVMRSGDVKVDGSGNARLKLNQSRPATRGVHPCFKPPRV